MKKRRGLKAVSGVLACTLLCSVTTQGVSATETRGETEETTVYEELTDVSEAEFWLDTLEMYAYDHIFMGTGQAPYDASLEQDTYSLGGGLAYVYMNEFRVTPSVEFTVTPIDETSVRIDITDVYAVIDELCRQENRKYADAIIPETVGIGAYFIFDDLDVNNFLYQLGQNIGIDYNIYWSEKAYEAYNAREMIVKAVGLNSTGTKALYGMDNLVDTAYRKMYLPKTVHTVTLSDPIDQTDRKNGFVNFSNCCFEGFEVAEDNPVLTAKDGVLIDKTRDAIVSYPLTKALSKAVKTGGNRGFGYDLTGLNEVAEYSVVVNEASTIDRGALSCFGHADIETEIDGEVVTLNDCNLVFGDKVTKIDAYTCSSMGFNTEYDKYKSLIVMNKECEVPLALKGVFDVYGYADSKVADTFLNPGAVKGYTPLTFHTLNSSDTCKDTQIVAPAHYGDITGDNKVTIADVVGVNMYTLTQGEFKLSVQSLANSDVMKDGVIDTNDTALLLNYVGMLIDYEALGVA